LLFAVGALGLMEIVIQGTQGILPESILSIRNGSTRRQAPLAAVDKPFRFPVKPEDCASVKIDVFRHVGTARTVSQAGESEHRLVLDSVRGTGLADPSAEGMEVSFLMRPAMKDTTHTISSGHIDPIKKDKTYAETDDYLEQHNITKFLQLLLQGLIKERPLDPYGFIVKQFVAEANQLAAARDAAKPLEVVSLEPTDLRDEVRGLFASGLQSGLFEQALNSASQDEIDRKEFTDMFGTAARLGSAATEVEELRNIVQSLQSCMMTLVEENNELGGNARMPIISLPQATQACTCGNLLMDDALYCRKCGNKREAIMMGAHFVLVGSEVRLQDGTKGVVKERTTTDLLVKFDDGTEKWFNVEDLSACGILAAARELAQGEEVVCFKDGAKGRVKECTTTDVLLVMEDGSEVWFPIEDLRQVLPTAHNLLEGDIVVLVRNGRKGVITCRTTTDVKIRWEDGTEEWVDVEDVATPKQTDAVKKLAAASLDGRLAKALTEAPGLEDIVPEPEPPQVVDLTHVEALHRELEQLAKDRQALMAQVNLIRDKMDEVGQENRQLASEVLSRPISAGGTSARQQELGQKYTA